MQDSIKVQYRLSLPMIPDSHKILYSTHAQGTAFNWGIFTTNCLCLLWDIKCEGTVTSTHTNGKKVTIHINLGEQRNHAVMKEK